MKHLRTAFSIRLVVPFGPGGSGDITARAFAQYLEAQTKQSVVIDNRAGANGILGTEMVKNSPADGYTMLLTSITTLADLVSYSKANPDKVFFGHHNSDSQMTAEMFRVKTGAPMTGVPYKAIGSALQDSYGKQQQVMFIEYLPAMAQIDNGKVLALGVTAPTRFKAWPNVPAIAETYPGYELGLEPSKLSRADYTKFVGGEITRWVQVIKDAGVQPE